ncbi:MAG TPA: autotransporter-associated beta strand repeat-containing protein, partial [Luteolibacter sp.]|nr:autotransporter-associated beta strand repeat-containing protein [Luteolibacter sp.]
ISGAITSSTGPVGLIKEGEGTLVLSAVNTYTGDTTISGGNLRIGNTTGGTLNGGNYSGNISIASGATLQIWSTAAQTLSGIISGAGGLDKAYNGTLTLSGPNTYTGRTTFLPQTTAGFTVNVSSFNSVNGGTPLMASSSLGAPTTVANGTIDLGSGGKRANVTLNYTGSGETTDRVINLGFNDTSSQTISASGSGLLKFTSAMTSNAASQTGQLILSGTGGGEITQALPALPTGGLTKSGTGAWTLGGDNAYTGPTTISAGKLFIHGDQSTATGDVSVAANATLGGSGTIGGNTTIAANGRLEFDLGTAAASHDPLDLASGRTLTFSGASVLTITSGGGASPGTYTLVTAPGGITGSAPAALNLPVDWAATTEISGNSLVLNVTSTGSGPGPVDSFTITGVPAQTTVGAVINGITITALDEFDQTATSFSGTVVLGGTAGITGTTANFVDGVLENASIAPAITGSGLTFTVDDGEGHTGSVTFDVLTVFESWAAANDLVGPNADPAANPDGDSLNNLQEFAFGTDPLVSSSSPISYVPDGNVTSPGLPEALNLATGEGVDYRAVFGRRRDYQAAGLTYTVQFSAGLDVWVDSSDAPTVLTGENNESDIEAVSVPYPLFIPVEGGFKKPTFFRVGVSMD